MTFRQTQQINVAACDAASTSSSLPLNSSKQCGVSQLSRGHGQLLYLSLDYLFQSGPFTGPHLHVPSAIAPSSSYSPHAFKTPMHTEGIRERAHVKRHRRHRTATRGSTNPHSPHQHVSVGLNFPQQSKVSAHCSYLRFQYVNVPFFTWACMSNSLLNRDKTRKNMLTTQAQVKLQVFVRQFSQCKME